MIGSEVSVSEGVSLLAGVTDETMVTLGSSGIIMGVGLRMAGVREGIGVHTGKGWVCAVNRSQAARIKTIDDQTMILFTASLYTPAKAVLQP